MVEVFLDANGQYMCLEYKRELLPPSDWASVSVYNWYYSDTCYKEVIVKKSIKNHENLNEVQGFKTAQALFADCPINPMIHVYGYFETNEHVYIVSEKASGDFLSMVIDSKHPMKSKFPFLVCRLIYLLHRLNYVHGDLSCEQFLQVDDTLVLCDPSQFKMVNIDFTEFDTNCHLLPDDHPDSKIKNPNGNFIISGGKANYNCQEKQNGQPFSSFKNDLHCIAVIIYIIETNGRMPYDFDNPKTNADELRQKFINGIYPLPISPLAGDFLKHLFMSKSFTTELMKHPYLHT